jgi:Ethanolamine utilization protein EutJ (predicted chaperonin)
MLGGTVVGVAVGVRVGVPVGTGEPAAQVGQGVAKKFFSAVPQEAVLKFQSESRFGQELGVMDQAVPPAMPAVPDNQEKIFVSKVESSVLQLVEGPYSPTKTG